MNRARKRFDDRVRLNALMEGFKSRGLTLEEGLLVADLMSNLNGTRASVMWFAAELATKMAEIAEDEGVI